MLRAPHRDNTFAKTYSRYQWAFGTGLKTRQMTTSRCFAVWYKPVICSLLLYPLAVSFQPVRVGGARRSSAVGREPTSRTKDATVWSSRPKLAKKARSAVRFIAMWQPQCAPPARGNPRANNGTASAPHRSLGSELRDVCARPGVNSSTSTGSFPDLASALRDVLTAASPASVSSRIPRRFSPAAPDRRELPKTGRVAIHDRS